MANSSVSGISAFRQQIAAGLSAQHQSLRNRLNQLGIQMTAEIRAAAPVLSGATAASVRYVIFDTAKGESLEIKVGDATAFYVPHVEFGTSEAPAHPFVRPVVYRHEGKIPAQIEEAVGQAWQ
jgi:HK97 gp10 family phage protein